MKPDDHLEAFQFLHSASVPAEKKIDSMSGEELDEYLAAHGVDLAKLNRTIEERKLQLAGRFALAAARKKRLAERQRPKPDIPIPATLEEMMDALKMNFGADLPLAAQKAKASMSPEELGQLYRDIMAKRPNPPDAG
jgi:hypothetical protein